MGLNDFKFGKMLFPLANLSEISRAQRLTQNLGLVQERSGLQALTKGFENSAVSALADQAAAVKSLSSLVSSQPAPVNALADVSSAIRAVSEAHARVEWLRDAGRGIGQHANAIKAIESAHAAATMSTAALGTLGPPHAKRMADIIELAKSAARMHEPLPVGIIDKVSAQTRGAKSTAATFAAAAAKQVMLRELSTFGAVGKSDGIARIVDSIMRITSDHETSAMAALRSTRFELVSRNAAVLNSSMPKFDVDGIIGLRASRRTQEHGIAGILRTLDALATDAAITFPAVDPHTKASRAEVIDGAEDETTESVPNQHSLIYIPGRPGKLASDEAELTLAPVRVFVGAAKRDRRLRGELLKHMSTLRHQGLIDPWHEDIIIPGNMTETAIWENFQLAQIVLLLLSADFIQQYCDRRMEFKFAEKAKSATIIPVLVRDVDLTDSIFDVIIPPVNRRPVARSQTRDRQWMKVALKIRMIVNNLRANARKFIQ